MTRSDLERHLPMKTTLSVWPPDELGGLSGHMKPGMVLMERWGCDAQTVLLQT